MKTKNFLNLKSWLLMMLMLIGVGGNVWAAETGTITFGNNNVKINAASVTGNDSQGNTWTITTTGTTSFSQSTSLSQVGSKDKPATSITFTTTLPNSVEITAFSAKFGGFSGTKGDVSLKVGGVEVGTGTLNQTSDVTVSSTTQSVTDNSLTVTVTNIDRGVKCYYISYTYETSGGETPSLETSDLALTNAPVSLSFDLYNNSSAQTVSYTTSSTGAITVSQSDYVTTIVDETNKTITVTPTTVTPSAQTITVSQAADGTYDVGSATFTVTVDDSTPASEITEETIVFANLGYENAADITTVEGLAATLTFNKGTNDSNSPKYYTTGSGARMYNGNTLKIESEKAIVSIEFVFDGSNTTLALANGQPGNLSDASNSVRTWTGNANSVQFTTTATNRIKSIKITYGEGTAMQDAELSYTPTFYTATIGGENTFPTLTNPHKLSVTYSSSNEEVATVDESTGEVTIVGAGTTTITATFAGNDDYNAATASYTLTVNEAAIEGQLFYESFNSFSGTGGNDNQWSGSIASNAWGTTDVEGWTVEKGNAANKCAKFGTSSALGKATTPAITQLNGNATLTFKAAAWNGNSESTTLKLSITDGTINPATVTLVKGQWTEYTVNIEGVRTSTITFEGNSASNSRFFLDEILVVEAPAAAVETPSFSLASGNYFEAQSVTISCETEGATIYYTTDGTEPTNASTEYTSAISISETTTLKAIAYVDEDASIVATATYTIAPSYGNCKAANDAATKDHVVSRVNFADALVTYKNGQNTYLKDETAGFLIYGNTDLTVGDKVTGYVQGELYLFNGLPEVASPTLNVEVISSGNEVKPVEVAADDLKANPLNYVNQYVQVSPATFAAADFDNKNVTFTVNENEFVLRNNFNVGVTFNTEDKYKVAGFVAIYNDAVQFYPTATTDVTKIPMVAQIGEQKYETLADAIAAVPANGTKTTITMLSNHVMESGLTVGETQNIVLDLAGYTVSGTVATSSANTYLVSNKGTLEITDNSQGQTGKITYKNTTPDGSYSKETCTIYSGGKLTLTSGTIENTTVGGASYAVNSTSNAWGTGDDKEAVFNMTGGTLSCPSGDQALRVYQNCAQSNTPYSHNTVTISGGKILDSGIFLDNYIYQPTASTTGDGILTSVTISGGEIHGLIDMKLRHTFNTSLTITGGTFVDSRFRVRKVTSEWNSNVAEPTAPVVTISGGQFSFAKDYTAFGLNGGNGSGTTWTSYNKPYAISGGVFDLAVPEEYCAIGYLPADNTNAETSQVYPYTVAPRPYVAQIEGGDQYYSLADAIAAVPADGTQKTITMIADEAVVAGITIAAGQNIVLELNGKTVSGNTDSSNTYALITNKGTLTIQDNTDTNKDGTGTGLITTYIANPDGGDVPGYASNTITNSGDLTVKSGKIVNNGSGYACYAIDNQTNGTAYTPTLKIEGGRMQQMNAKTYAVRMFCNSTTNLNSVEVSGGVIEGGYGLWLQTPNTNANMASLTITGGVFNANDGAALYIGGTKADNSKISINIEDGQVNGTGVIIQGPLSGTYGEVSISDGEFANVQCGANVEKFITGGTFGEEPAAAYLADAYMAKKVGDVYEVVPAVAKVGDVKYETFAEAIAALTEENNTITLLADIAEAYTLAEAQSLNVNLNGHTLTVAAPEGYILKTATAEADGVTTYSYVAPVAKISETLYATLQAAVDAAYYNMTGDVQIDLVSDITEYVVIKQKANLNLTVDGGDNTITGQIFIDGRGRSTGAETLTISNLNFTGTKAGFYNGTDAFIYIPVTKTAGTIYYDNNPIQNNYSHNVTISNCTFTNTGTDLDVVAFKSNSGGANCYNLVIENATGTNLHSLAQLTATEGSSRFNNCNVTNSDGFININGGNSSFDISGCTFTSITEDGYAVRLKSNSSSVVTLNNNTFTADKAIQLGKNDSSTGSIKVESGKYNGKIVDLDNGTASVVVSGGLFSKPVAEAYCAEGYICAANPDAETSATYPYMVKEGQYMAQVGEQKYETLAEAIASVPENGTEATTVKLLTGVSETARVVGGRNIELDLNEQTLTGAVALGEGSVNVKNGTVAGTVYIYGSAEEGATGYNHFTLDATATINSGWGFILYEASGTKVAYGSTIDIYGNVNGNAWVMGNIEQGNSVINVYDGAVISGEVFGLNGFATLNVKEGSTITGSETGIEVRAGRLNVEGGTISSTASEYTYKPNLSGTTTTGAAIAVAQHSTLLSTDVDIKGGTLSGVHNIVVVDAQENNLEGVAITVKDELVTESTLIPADFKWVAGESEGTVTLVMKEYVAQVGEQKYETLAEAVNAAQSGETIELLADITSETGNKSLKEGVTLDGKGKTISGDIAIYINKNGGTIQNVNFKDIHNAKNDLSAVYGNSLEGTATIKDCSFDNCDWDAIQITPVAGGNVVITGNMFSDDNEDGVTQQRYIHVQSGQNVDFSATITENVMPGKLKQEPLGVYYPTDKTKVDLTKNYIESINEVCILLANNDGYAGELVFPAYTTAEKQETWTAVAMIADGKYAANFYSAFADAAAAAGNNTIKLLADVEDNYTLGTAQILNVKLNDYDLQVLAPAGYQLNTVTNDGITTYTAEQIILATPIIFHDAGEYEGKLTVAIAGQGTIMYKLGDSEAQAYSAPFEISETTKVTAWTEQDGIKSAEVSKTFTIVAKQAGPSVTDGYYNIKAGDKYVNVAGRKTVTLVENADGMPGTVIRVKATNGKVETLRSQGVDVPSYAQKAMNYVPEIVRLAVDKLHAEGAGELLGEHGLDAIMTKFDESFDYNLYLEGENNTYRIYGKTPSMKPVVDFYAENKDNVDAKLPQLEQFINSAIDKVLEKTGGRGAGILVDFDLETVWQKMGGTLTEPVDEASTAKFYEEVLTSEGNVWNFAYQTAMIYWGNLKNNDTFKNNLDKLGDYAKYIDKVENIQPNFKYYIVPSESGVDFISKGNIAITDNDPSVAWTMESVDKFNVNFDVVQEHTVYSTNGGVLDEYSERYTTLYTDFAYTLPDGVKAYKVKSISDKGVAVREEITGTIPAQTPVMLINTDNANSTKALVLSTEDGTPVTGNLLVGADELINQYQLKTSQVESLFNLAKDVIGESAYNEYLSKYEHLMLTNAGTVNNKYFFGLSAEDVEKCVVKNENNEEDCVIRSLSEGEEKVGFYDNWTAGANKAFLVTSDFNSVKLSLVGDVDRDGKISIGDVTALVNIILGKATYPKDNDKYDFEAAEVDGDKKISIADVTKLVNIILGKE